MPPRVNRNVNYELWVSMNNIDCSWIVRNVPLWFKMLIVRDVVHMLGQWVHGNSVLSAQFFCELKPALKNKVYFLTPPDFSQLKLGHCQPLPQFYAEFSSAQAPS